jgi:hypothetical protein
LRSNRPPPFNQPSGWPLFRLIGKLYENTLLPINASLAFAD